jgi:formylmethanofuran dehydrogenase subunit C
VSDGLTARLKAPLRQRTDFAQVLAGSWVALGAGELARRPVQVDGTQNSVPLGDLFDIRGEPSGSIRLEGDLGKADRLGTGLSEGHVIVAGDVGDEAGLGMSGGVLEILGKAGARAGAAAPEARRGMTGGELVIHGAAGSDAGTRMRRGLLVIGRDATSYVGQGMIAGTAVVFGDAGADPVLWSKRGSLVALGKVSIPVTYRYACTYQPIQVRLLLTRLRTRYRLPVDTRHLNGFFRRYSGDMAELGKGEILEWVAS